MGKFHIANDAYDIAILIKKKIEYLVIKNIKGNISKMFCRFYDVLPPDIQTYIFEIRLQDSIYKKYVCRKAQKMELFRFIVHKLIPDNIEHENDDGIETNTIMFYPFTLDIAYITEKCSRILTKNDDIYWLKSRFLIPLQTGLFVFKEEALTVIAATDADRLRVEQENYNRTLEAYILLIKKLDIVD